MRQLSQSGELAGEFRKAEEQIRKAVNRVLSRECGVREYASRELWPALVNEFRRTIKLSYDLPRYRRELETYALNALYFGALAKKAEQKTQRKRRSRAKAFVRPKSEARNRDIAWFVVERTVPFWQLFRSEHLLFGHPGPGSGVPWHALAEEWNRTRAHDPFGPGRTKTRGDNLKDEYYRARRRLEPALLEEFSDLLADVLGQLIREDIDFGRAIYEQAVAQRDQLLAKHPLAGKRIDTWTHAEEVEWCRWRDEHIRHYRDALTLRELIQRHLFWARRRTTSQSRQDWSCHALPLRPWFLMDIREARGEPVVLSAGWLCSFDPMTEVFNAMGVPRLA